MLRKLAERLGQARDSIENGEPVDSRKLSTLLALDAVVDGVQAAREAIDRQKAEDERLSDAQ